MNDEQWQRAIEAARREDETRQEPDNEAGDTRINFFCALSSPLCLWLAFQLPPDWGVRLVFAVWFLGGLVALIVLAFSAYTRNVSHKIKEAALCFLLGNGFVFLVWLSKPT